MPHKPTVPERQEKIEEVLLYLAESVENGWIEGVKQTTIDYLSTQEEEYGIAGGKIYNKKTGEEVGGIENFLSSRMVVEKPEEFSYQNPSSSRGQEYDTKEKEWELEFDKSFYKFQVYAPSDNYDIQTGANDIKDFIKKTLTTEREKMREFQRQQCEKALKYDNDYYLGRRRVLKDLESLLDHTE